MERMSEMVRGPETLHSGVKCKVDNPLDAEDAEDAGPGGETVVPERAPRKTRGKKTARDGQTLLNCFDPHWALNCDFGKHFWTVSVHT